MQQKIEMLNIVDLSDVVLVSAWGMSLTDLLPSTEPKLHMRTLVTMSCYKEADAIVFPITRLSFGHCPTILRMSAFIILWFTVKAATTNTTTVTIPPFASTSTIVLPQALSRADVGLVNFPLPNLSVSCSKKANYYLLKLKPFSLLCRLFSAFLFTEHNWESVVVLMKLSHNRFMLFFSLLTFLVLCAVLE